MSGSFVAGVGGLGKPPSPILGEVSLASLEALPPPGVYNLGVRDVRGEAPPRIPVSPPDTVESTPPLGGGPPGLPGNNSNSNEHTTGSNISSGGGPNVHTCVGATASSTAAPGSPGEATTSPGYADLAARLDAQAAVTSSLQSQLGAVIEEGRRQQAEATRHQGETSSLLKALGETLIAAQQQAAAAQQQTALQISTLEATMAAHSAEAARRDEQRDSLLSSFAHKMGDLETRFGHPAAASSAPPSRGADICSGGATESGTGGSAEPAAATDNFFRSYLLFLGPEKSII